VQKSAHDTGFMVAGAAKADLLSDFDWALELPRRECYIHDPYITQQRRLTWNPSG